MSVSSFHLLPHPPPSRGRELVQAPPPSRGRELVLFASIFLSFQTQALPTFAETKSAHRPSDVTLLDRQGAPIQTLRTDMTVRRLAWVPLTDVSPALLQAIVLSEDKRFYEHSGIDWSAIANSAWRNSWSTKTRGASTLTMQLAGLIDDGLARPVGGRSVAQKIGQAVTATQIDARWRKADILEAYVNSVPFRGEVVGINALSLTLFGKHPSGLDAHEAAVTAALLRGPNAPAATVAQRACGVLQLQGESCAGVTALTETALVRKGGPVLGEQIAPHFARLVAKTSPRSSLDAETQRVAINALQRQLSELHGRNVEDGAVLVLDNASGEVRAWVGSSGDLSGAAQVDGVLAKRQPGSTLKPFIYALAFEKKLITPASLLDDAPTQIATQSGLYIPQNYDRDFKGWVSARTALGASLNVPAVRVGAMLGPDALVERFNALGLALPQSGGFYGNALALGGAEVSLLGLTNAYRALANGGVFSQVALPAHTGAFSTKPQRVADAAAAYLTTNILADNNARVRTFGLYSSLATRGFAAVKTGTSKDLRDNWCVGYTDRYTVGVWVGNASGEPMHNVSGVSGAAPIWAAVVKHLHRHQASMPPSAPQGVVTMPIRFEAQREAARDEVFIAGTEQTQQSASAQMSGAQRYGIHSPRDGSLFAIDPDMPPQAQRISFEGESGVWMLDGKRVGAGPRISWSPWPGRHALSLVSRSGQTLQTVRFEVRGAGLKPTAAVQTR
jgi:penicillin-binding protein 1C